MTDPWLHYARTVSDDAREDARRFKATVLLSCIALAGGILAWLWLLYLTA